MKDWGWGHPGQVAWACVPLLLVLCYLFRPLHRPQRVAASFLWERVHTRLAGQSWWRRLQAHRLLWLQLLFCLLAIAALMSPYMIRPGLVGTQVALIVDTSASMQAGDSRLEGVLEEAARLVREAPAGCQFLVARLDRECSVVQPFSPDRALVLSQLKALKVRAVRGRDDLVTPFVLSLLRNQPQTQLHWFSDHPLREVPHVDHLDRRGELNYAIESFHTDGQQLFVAVKNYHSQPAELQLRVEGANQFGVDRSLSLRPGSRLLVRIPVMGQRGPFRARLLDEDDLSLDNEAFCLGEIPDTTRLVVHGHPGDFLIQAVQAASGATRIGTEQGEGIQLWESLPDDPGPGLHVAQLPPASWNPSPPRPKKIPPHPIGLVLTPELANSWQFRCSSHYWGAVAALPSGVEGIHPILQSPDGQPLLVEWRSSLIWLISLEESDLPLSPDLPVVISAWLNGHRCAQDSALCEQRIELGAPTQLSGPQGVETAPAIWSPTWPGLYQSAQGQNWAINFHAPEESDLLKTSLAPTISQVPPTPATGQPRRQEFSRILLSLAFLLLLLELRWWWRP